MSKEYLDRNQQNNTDQNIADVSQKKIDPVAQLKWINNSSGDQGFGIYDNPSVQMFVSEEEQLQRKPEESEQLNFEEFQGWGVFDNDKVIQFTENNKKEIEGGFTSRAWVWVEKLLNKIDRVVTSLTEKLEEKTVILISENNDNRKELSEKKKRKLGNQIASLRAQVNQHLQVVSEIHVIASSNQVYDVVSKSGANGEKISANAGFNFTNGYFEIVMPVNAGLDLFAHELLHAFQFEIGDFSVGPEIAGEYSNLLYDKHDEVDAYSRQDLYGSNEGVFNIGTLPDEYENISENSVDINSHPNLSAIANYPINVQKTSFKNIANSTGHAFRVNGVTYYKQR